MGVLGQSKYLTNFVDWWYDTFVLIRLIAKIGLNNYWKDMWWAKTNENLECEFPGRWKIEIPKQRERGTKGREKEVPRRPMVASEGIEAM